MITNDDLLKLSTVFATKEELSQLREEMNNRFDDLTTKDMHNEMMNKLDAFIAESRNIHEEQSIHASRHDDLEDRVSRIEAIPTVTTHLQKHPLD